jgi:hypothetical protein
MDEDGEDAHADKRERDVRKEAVARLDQQLCGIQQAIKAIQPSVDGGPLATELAPTLEGSRRQRRTYRASSNRPTSTTKSCGRRNSTSSKQRWSLTKPNKSWRRQNQI